MIQNKFKIFWVICFLASVIFFGCSKDFETHQDSNSHSLKIIPIKIGDITTNQIVLNKLINPKERFKKNQPNFGRVVNDTINNFSIDTESGTLIEFENYRSYTFNVIRPNGSYFLLENIVVSKEGDKEYETYLYQYSITYAEFNMLQQGVSVDLSNRITRITLENSNISDNISNKEDYNGMCFVETTTYTAGQTCGGVGAENHSWGDILGGQTCSQFGTVNGPWPGYYTTTASLAPCPSSGGTSSDTGGTGDTSGGSGGAAGGSGASYPVRSVPTLPELIDEELMTPQDLCNDLASKDANVDFAQKMQDLKNRANNQNFESAYTMFQNASAGLLFSPRYDGSTDYPEVSLGYNVNMGQVGTNSIGAIHCHLDNGKTFKIFSYSDLIALAEFASISTRPTSEFGIYVVTSSGTFCIKLKAKISFKNRKDIMIFNQNLFENSFEKFVNKNMTIDEQVLGFLKFLKENKFSDALELFKKDNTDGIWKRQELNSNGKSVNPTNC